MYMYVISSPFLANHQMKRDPRIKVLLTDLKSYLKQNLPAFSFHVPLGVSQGKTTSYAVRVPLLIVVL